ncbi:MAG TPA: hypothetical protein PKJ83_12180 [Cyclobacteriaceae bacterium]|nr:hypothetical protein [Cyclobacteriaceae bacterium]HPW60870.1 hypothetical protein [Cyclobacteriaceae bacterium]
MYADFHCHPAALAYDTKRLLPAEEINSSHPWAIPQSAHENKANASNKRYSQSDLAKCVRSGTKLLFASLSPPEKGFFRGVKGTRVEKAFVQQLHDQWHEYGTQVATTWLVKQMKSVPGYSNLKPSDFDFLGRSMNLKSEQVKKIQQGDYDYFEELKNEYRFFLRKAGQFTATSEEIQIDDTGIKRRWWGSYHLVGHGHEVNVSLDRDEIIIVPTLGGIHSLGIGNPEDEDLRPGEQPRDINLDTLKSRIRQLKGEELLQDPALPTWKHAPFYITFAQNFCNTLCGHTKSFPSRARLLFDQHKGQDLDVTHTCIDVWLEFLGLDKELRPTGSKRILIDINHMSAAARFTYYKEIIKPFNKEHPLNPLPVIASHAGYAGLDSLEDMVQNTARKKETDDFFLKGFLAWSINLCDQDIIEIFKSCGLLGISFDKRLLGTEPHAWLNTMNFGPLDRLRALRIFRRTLEQFVRIPFEYNLSEPLTIWDRLCMGTGFDGAMQPMPRYSSVLQFSLFEQDLVDILDGMKREEPMWFGSYRPEALARKICFENAYDFVRKHY